MTRVPGDGMAAALDAQHGPRILSMRAAGRSNREIADELGISRSVVSWLYWRQLGQLRQDHAPQRDDQIRAQLGVLSDLLETASGLCGDDVTPETRLAAIGKALACSERISKLLGLDAPSEHKITAEVGRLSDDQVMAELHAAGYRQLSADEITQLEAYRASKAQALP